MSEHINEMFRAAIRSAVDASKNDGARRVVGLQQDGDGARIVWPLESEAKALLGFTPGWIVTGDGEVLPTLERGEERRAN